MSDRPNKKALTTFTGARAELMESIAVVRATLKEAFGNPVWGWRGTTQEALRTINAELDAIEVWITRMGETMQEKDTVLARIQSHRLELIRQNEMMRNWMHFTPEPPDD